MVYKVLFTGTFETGKTTLIERFKEDPHIEIVPEVARDLLESDPKLELSPVFQDLVFAEQVKREIEAEKCGKSIILCDRGLLDIIAFSEVLGHSVKPMWVESIWNRYNYVFLFSINDIPVPLQNYDLGIDIIDYRIRVDKKIKEVILRYDIEFLEVNGSIDVREKMVKNHLNNR